MTLKSLSNMTTQKQTRTLERSEISPLEARKTASMNKVLCAMLHRRALEFQQRLRQVRAKLQNNRQRLVFDYIFDCTIGFNKLNDHIALSQFEHGKRNRETGEVIDSGCGLSHNPIRQARKELIKLGLIVEQEVKDERGASIANAYTIRFVVEMVEAEIAHRKMKPLKRYTHRGYQLEVATIKSPLGITKQRCVSAKSQKKSNSKTHYMHREHVDYLVEEIEKVTGDTHSRGGFAQLALSVPEGTILELLHQLRDRRNIQNKGAWLFATARRYAKRQLIRADEPQQTEISYSDTLQHTRNHLTQNLSMGFILKEQKPLPIYEQKRLLELMKLNE
jgi:hypothetical protein